MSRRRQHRPLEGHNARHEAQSKAAVQRSLRAAEEALEDNCDESAIAALSYWCTARPDQPEFSPEFVYFVQEEQRGNVKIGVAADPIARVRRLQCGNPDLLFVREVIRGGYSVERQLHRHWMEAHVWGEWFGKGYEQAILAAAAETSKQQRLEDIEGGLWAAVDPIPKAA